MFSGVILANDLRVYPPGQQPNDARLGELRNLNGYFPFQVPASRGAWEASIEVVNLADLLAFGDANTTSVNANATAVGATPLPA